MTYVIRYTGSWPFDIAPDTPCKCTHVYEDHIHLIGPPHERERRSCKWLGCRCRTFIGSPYQIRAFDLRVDSLSQKF